MICLWGLGGTNRARLYALRRGCRATSAAAAPAGYGGTSMPRRRAGAPAAACHQRTSKISPCSRISASRSCAFDAEKARELLREHVVRTDVVGIQARRRLVAVRQFAEPAIGDQAQLVVVVEDRAAVPGQAEILEQQVAREDVVARQILDRLAVVEDRLRRRASGIVSRTYRSSGRRRRST